MYLDYLGIALFACGVQYVVMLMTKARRWSIHCMIRNISISWATVAVFQGVTPLVYFTVIFIEGTIVYMKYRFFSIDPWVSTDYLYSDYFESFVNEGPASLKYYTEGMYGKLLGLDTLNHSVENVKKTIKYGEDLASNKNLKYLPCDDRKQEKMSIDDAAKMGQQHKFAWIVDACRIKPGARVVEIGFGRTDLMQYLREQGAEVVGVDMSKKQVALARHENFHAVQSNFWDMPSKQSEIGNEFDVVISNGSLEYYRLSHQSDAIVYTKVFQVVKSFLKADGLYLCTTLHLNTPVPINFRNVFMTYFLWTANDGFYPLGHDGLTKYAEKENFHVLIKQNRWLDYYLYSCLWVANFRKYFKTSIKIFLKNIHLLIVNPHFLQAFYTYAGFRLSLKNIPWFWQFFPQGRDYKYVPVTHQWIVFQKK